MLPRLVLLAVLAAGATYAGTHNPRGAIAFGTGYDNGTGAIQGARTVFPASGSISWVAHFTQSPGTTTLTRLVLQPRPGNGTAIAGAVKVRISDADAGGVYADRTVPQLEQEMGIGPGTYTMQYRTDSTVLAEGTFTLSP